MFTGHVKWETRWQSSFNASDPFFSGAAPVLDLADAATPGSAAAGVARVYYASVLSIVSQMRTNLPLMHDKVFPTSQGSNEELAVGGVVIGGAVSYFWDEALSSTLLSFLEPSGRPSTIQAWLTMDLKGKRHNWFALDCAPIGAVYDGCNFTTAAATATTTSNEVGNPWEGNVYPYNIWSYGKAMFNHMTANNDTNFLKARAAQSNITVDEALGAIVLDWQGSVIEGTRLTDYGGNLDGFSKTYMHVLPGMQGNNIWMMRQLAVLRELQGSQAEAARLRAEALAMANETITTMFASSKDGQRGWFNVIYGTGPTGPNGAKTKPLEAHEMRHVVDLFSLAFGLCGVKGEHISVPHV